VKKAYAKIKAAELATASCQRSTAQGQQVSKTHSDEERENDESTNRLPTPSLELHPERQAMLNAPEQELDSQRSDNRRRVGGVDARGGNGERRERRRPRPSAFAKEIAISEQRRKEREAKEKERGLKAQEREAMARARRPDQFGKRRLGRESKALLGKVQRIVGQI
jgi:hypothetical protein